MYLKKRDMKNNVFFCWEQNVHLKALVISTNLEFGCGKYVLHSSYDDLVFFLLVLLYEDTLKDLLEWPRTLLAPSYTGRYIRTISTKNVFGSRARVLSPFKK